MRAKYITPGLIVVIIIFSGVVLNLKIENSSAFSTVSGNQSSTSTSHLQKVNKNGSSGSGTYNAPATTTTNNTVAATNNSTNDHKFVLINFDDGYKSQLIYAKPILDKYGFKASAVK
jgi:peptidoglycan/xylan/chitin deacetylase (PgdA/CDA1 family)